MAVSDTNMVASLGVKPFAKSVSVRLTAGSAISEYPNALPSRSAKARGAASDEGAGEEGNSSTWMSLRMGSKVRNEPSSGRYTRSGTVRKSVAASGAYTGATWSALRYAYSAKSWASPPGACVRPDDEPSRTVGAVSPSTPSNRPDSVARRASVAPSTRIGPRWRCRITACPSPEVAVLMVRGGRDESFQGVGMSCR